MYHEIRKERNKIKNYLIVNKRVKTRWVKESKFIGYGKINAEQIPELKKEFELELKSAQKYAYLNTEQVLEIEKLRQAYFEKIGLLGTEETETFNTSFFTELTYNSNSIEGNSLSLEETSLVINEHLIPEGKTLREIYEAQNHLKAIQFLKKYSGNIDERMILKLHFIILYNISERFAGRYREGTVRIFGSNVTFPDSGKVPQRMKNLVYWYHQHKKKYHPFELAVIFSTKLVSIHPFVDGNGRVSRLIMNFILGKHKYPWINVYTKQRVQYLVVIRKVNEEEYAPAIEFMIKSLRENLQGYGFL